jgi:hypothetical protein
MINSINQTLIVNRTSAQNTPTDETIFEKGYRYNIQGRVYIHIEEEPYERGYQYGYLASAEIKDMIQRCSNFAHQIKFMKIFIFKRLQNKYFEFSEKWWEICRTNANNIKIKIHL